LIKHSFGNYKANLTAKETVVFALAGRVRHVGFLSAKSLCMYEPCHRMFFPGDTVFAGRILSHIRESGSLADSINSTGLL